MNSKKVYTLPMDHTHKKEDKNVVNIQRIPDDFFIVCENENTDASLRFELDGDGLRVFLTADRSLPRYVSLRWNYRTEEPVRVLGDKWERAYADLTFKGLDGERFMPWYFIATNGTDSVGCGVAVRPESFVSFEYDASGVSGWFDVRCGDAGVQLNGREIKLGTVMTREYKNTASFDAACAFCRQLCTDPILPSEPVYGGNNWYYAYGNSSAAEILSDSGLIAGLSKGNSVRPFMVIDDGWQINSCNGPWLPNEKFGDMKELADKMRDTGVRPGIWVRFLHDTALEAAHPEWTVRGQYLDPTVPQVADLVRQVIARVKGWGYELIKHDFTTFDLFGQFGYDFNGSVSRLPGWSFADRTKTSAQVVLDLYRLIREAAGDTLIIGCNTVSHLSAGLVEISRVGDDTSGTEWNRTRAMGVNALAFRLPQNRAFYMADADCVGIIPGKIDWKLNREWTRLLAKSGTPLFISCPAGGLDPVAFEEMRQAFALASVQEDVAVPLDWEYNNQPQTWLINGEVERFDFVQDSYPLLLDNVMNLSRAVGKQ